MEDNKINALLVIECFKVIERLLVTLQGFKGLTAVHQPVAQPVEAVTDSCPIFHQAG